jgi:hypothetical protein
MSVFNSSTPQTGSKKLTRLMKRAESKMAPHIDKFLSPDGMMAGLLISGAAAIAAQSKGSKKHLRRATKEASKISGIPLDALTAHAECSLAMCKMSNQMQRTSPFVGGDNE